MPSIKLDMRNLDCSVLSLPKNLESWVWRFMPVILVLNKLRREVNQKFKTSVGYTVRHWRDSLTDKGTHRSCRGPEISSLHPHQATQSHL